MSSLPEFTFPLPTDGSTVLTAGFFSAWQAALEGYISQFMPLVGSSFLGVVDWDIAQQFPADQVILPGDAPYPHQNMWRSVLDHINDPSVHLQLGTPLAHGSSHELGGTDLLTGDLLQITAEDAGLDIKTYIDSSVAAATGAFVALNYAPATYYEIGGIDPLFGNLMAINGANPSTDIQTYVDSAIAALSGALPANPAFTSITLTGSAGVIFSGSPLQLIDNGKPAVRSDGTNLFLACGGNTGAINFSNQGTSSAFGSLSAAGYTIGSTNVGPLSSALTGTLTVSDDVSMSRSAQGAPDAGVLHFGQAADDAWLSYGTENAGGFYLSRGLNLAGGLDILAGGTLTVGPELTVTTTALTMTGIPLEVLSGTGMSSLGLDPVTGSLELHSSLANGQPYIDFVQNSSSLLDAYTVRLELNTAGTALVSTAGLNATFLALNGAHAASGDVGVARGASAGQLSFGTTTTQWIDFGVTLTGGYTFAAGGTTLAQITANGSYSIAGSSYGPVGALVNGIIHSTAAIQANTGLTFAGASGYVFTDSGTGFDTGMFSNGAGDLRFYTGSSNSTLSMLNGASTFGGTLTVTGALTGSTMTTSASLTVGTDLTLTGILYAGNTAISKFRVKSDLSLGQNVSTTTTGFVYQPRVVSAMTAPTVDALRLCAVTADTTATASTWNIKQNGAVIGTIALPNGQRTAKAYPIVNPTPLSEGDILEAVCTQAGTSTGVVVSLELSQAIQ